MRDLTHPIETGMSTYPGDPEVTVAPAATHETDGYRVERVRMGSHTGTHVDAPAHTEADGKTLDAYAVDRFVRDAVRIDCRDLGTREPVPADRVPSTNAGLLVVETGWDDHWGTDRYRDHPYLPPETADRCVEAGYAVATDTLSPDPTPSPTASDQPTGVPAHHALLGNDLLVVENLRNLRAVPDRFELRFLPLALRGDGAPVRAVAVP